MCVAMQVKLLAFAQAREQLGTDERLLACEPHDTPREVLARCAPELPLSGLRVALDGEYRGWDEPIGPASEIAIIPPVSGG